MLRNRKTIQKQKPYFLSVLAIFKNEAMNIKEWIDHYLWQGVDHFYLINNGSTDEYKNILDQYSNITLYNFNEQHRQVQYYNTIYPEIKTTSKWLIVVDLDEFYFCKNQSIRSFLHDKDEIDIFQNYWSEFGSSGLEKHPKSIRKSLIWKKKTLSSQWAKYIVQTDFCDGLGMHFSKTRREKVITNDPLLQVNHYQIQSKEFYEKVKINRTNAQFKEFDNGYTWKKFEELDYKDILDTTLADMI